MADGGRRSGEPGRKPGGRRPAGGGGDARKPGRPTSRGGASAGSDRRGGRDEGRRGQPARAQPARPQRREERAAPASKGKPEPAETSWSRSGTARPRPARPARVTTAAKPALPSERPRLERSAWSDLRSNVDPARLDDIAKAFGAAGDALELGEVERALELLQWAKSAGGRSPAIREALGIALYLHGDFAAAGAELQAYQRLSGRNDQNHVLADCARAAGRSDKVQAYVAAMDPGEVGPARWAEGLIVLASDRADRGDLPAAMATLERAELEPRRIQAWHPRVWYAAADIAERSGDRRRARELFEAILAVDPEFLDVEDRLAALTSG